MSCIMIVLDGLQDTAYPELGGKTPYDRGKAAGLKEIEAACVTGRLSATPAGFEPDTLTCVLTVLGVGVPDIPAGRTAIEALAVGLPVGRDDLTSGRPYMLRARRRRKGFEAGRSGDTGAQRYARGLLQEPATGGGRWRKS